MQAGYAPRQAPVKAQQATDVWHTTMNIKPDPARPYLVAAAAAGANHAGSLQVQGGDGKALRGVGCSLVRHARHRL